VTCWRCNLCTDSDILQLDNVTVMMSLKNYNNIILGDHDCPRPTTNPLQSALIMGLSFISNRQRRKEGTFSELELAGIEPTSARSGRAGYAHHDKNQGENRKLAPHRTYGGVRPWPAACVSSERLAWHAVRAASGVCCEQRAWRVALP
jgi:hypothetical protein